MYCVLCIVFYVLCFFYGPLCTAWNKIILSYLILYGIRHPDVYSCPNTSSSSPRYLLSDWFLPVFGTVDTGKGWKSQVCPRAIGGITTCHKMRHSLSLPTVTYICMGELPHFHHSPTTSFLHSQPIQAPPSGPGLVCAAGQMFIWDDPSVTPLSWSFTKGVPLLYPQCGTSILFWGVKCFCVSGCKPVLGRALAMEWVSRVIFLEAAICVGGNLSALASVCGEELSPPVHTSRVLG